VLAHWDDTYYGEPDKHRDPNYTTRINARIWRETTHGTVLFEFESALMNQTKVVSVTAAGTELAPRERFPVVRGTFWSTEAVQLMFDAHKREIAAPDYFLLPAGMIQGAEVICIATMF
jgi:hypothetical protein